MKKLEQFIDFDKNDLIGEMSTKELIYFLFLLNNYDLEYREKLNLPTKYTFGIEIEGEYIDGPFYNQIKHFYEKGWKQKNEETLENGDEYISPILTDTIDTWNDIKEICEILNEHYQIKDTCGAHIHIGSHILGSENENWINLFKMWSVYENIIFRFSYGEYLNPRTYMLSWSRNFSDEIYNKLKNDKINELNYLELIKYFNINNRYSLNLKNVKNNQNEKNNTIEIRCPNGTLNPVIWQNNINFFVKFILYCKNERLDEDVLVERRLLNGETYRLEDYDKIYLDQAIELADLIFNNNLDKVYFLRQYLKSFQIGFKTDGLEKAKQFTKYL